MEMVARTVDSSTVKLAVLSSKLRCGDAAPLLFSFSFFFLLFIYDDNINLLA
jgi:hypothetical protein